MTRSVHPNDNGKDGSRAPGGDPQKLKDDDDLDERLDQTFPASDAVAQY